jgi:hypothetical protein
MIYDLWNDESNVPSNMELEDTILELVKKLGESYDWKRTAPSVISSKAWKIVQDIARGGQALTNVEQHCKHYLKGFALRMVEDGFNIEEELKNLKRGV